MRVAVKLPFFHAVFEWKFKRNHYLWHLKTIRPVMEDIFSVLFFVGMLVIGIVGQKKKGAARTVSPSPDALPPEECEVELVEPEQTVAASPAAPLRPSRTSAVNALRGSVPSPTPRAAAPSSQPAVSEPEEQPLTESVRQGIIWSEILHRKYS